MAHQKRLLLLSCRRTERREASTRLEWLCLGTQRRDSNEQDRHLRSWSQQEGHSRRVSD